MSHTSNNKGINRAGKRKVTDGTSDETAMRLGRSNACTSCRQRKVLMCTHPRHTGIDEIVRIVRMRLGQNISSPLLEMQD